MNVWQKVCMANQGDAAPCATACLRCNRIATVFSPMMVYCVTCVDDNDQGCCVHIFSTQEKADAFVASDPRPHVLYDYVIDCPERMEQAIG